MGRRATRTAADSASGRLPFLLFSMGLIAIQNEKVNLFATLVPGPAVK